MRKISILTLVFSVIASSFAIANEVNVFNARHYKADSELYSKFTSMTGIKVNLINGKSGALEKRIISEGADSSADLYITADACLLYTSPSPRDRSLARMPSSA